MGKKLTIVGPVPLEAEQQKLTKKPHIETVLLMAKYNKQFRQKLLTERVQALADMGLEFTAGERMLLTSISNAQLKANINTFSLPGISRNSLATWSKAAAVLMLIISLTLSLTTAGCVTKGILPDVQQENTIDKPSIDHNKPTRGIAPDEEITKPDEDNEEESGESGDKE